MADLSAAKKNLAAVTIDIDTLMAEASLSGVDEVRRREIRKISYSEVLPEVLDLFSELKIQATFFIIGRDGLEPSNKKVIERISGNGHEIANHSLLHDRNLCNFEEPEFMKDVSESGKILSDIAGRRISGFRMPGCTINRKDLIILESMGYKYDSSLNSSFFYNLSKACYGLFFGRGQKVPYQDFGSLCAKNEPYFPSRRDIYKSSNDNMSILEFPITLIPWLSFPFMNYFLLAMGKFLSKKCYEMVKSRAEFINFVMHDNEIASWEKYKEFKLSYPLCGWHLKKKISGRKIFIKQIIESIKKDYDIVTLEEYADQMAC